MDGATGRLIAQAYKPAAEEAKAAKPTEALTRAQPLKVLLKRGPAAGIPRHQPSHLR